MKPQDLLDYKNWAVVGTVSDQNKYAYKILNSLKSSDFKVEGVNPKDTNEKTFKSLKDIPYKIDVLDLCINPKKGIDIVKEAKELGIKKILIQPGAESTEILEYCKKESITAIESCALVLLSVYKNN